MIIPFANSIRFRKVDANYQNFDNTLTQNEKFFNDSIFTYCQRFLTTDTVTVQIKSDSATVPTVKRYNSSNAENTVTCSLVSSYTDIYFFEFEINMATLTDEQYITVTQGSEVWRSEPFRADADLLTELQNGEALMVEYYNTENALQVDFSTGITFKMYVEGTIKDYRFGGESSVYDNQDELTKLKETMSRLMTFKTLYVPRYIGETLRIASGFDVFVVNGVSYVREDLPEVTAIEDSNLIEFSMTLNDKEYLGVNSHDVGFDVDSIVTDNPEIMNLSEENASGSVTFDVPAGYQVHTLRAEWVSGAAVEVKLGTALAGDELVYPVNVSSSITGITIAIHADISRATDSSIYATVTGGVANLEVQLIKNIKSDEK